MGSVAAPLLAGFAVTVIALIITAPNQFRWVNPTLILLAAAAFALIACLQFTFRARLYAVSPAEIEQWWPDFDTPMRQEQLQREQRRHLTDYERWADRSRWAYNFGILFFLGGFTTALIPTGSISGARLFLIIAAAVLVAVEAGWIARDAWPELNARLGRSEDM
jgi:hypothetical protein